MWLGQQRSEPRGARTFSHGLLDSGVQCDRAFQFILADEDDAIHQLAQDLSRQLSHFLDCDAFRNRRATHLGLLSTQLSRQRRIERRLDTDDRYRRATRFDRRGDAGGKSATADRDHHHIEIGKLIQNFEADRALPRDDVLVVERVDESKTVTLLQITRVLVGIGQRLAMDDDVRTKIARVLDLHERRALRHHDRGGNAKARSVICDALRVVAGRHRDHARGLLGVRQ